jgi:hypothetical protein
LHQLQQMLVDVDDEAKQELDNLHGVLAKLSK